MSRKNGIGKILMDLGSAPNIKGFQYIKRGIQFCMSDPRSITNLTELIYKKIAEEYETTTDAVERAARNAIQTGWVNRDKVLAKDIFRNTLQSDSDTPSNALYIAAIAEWLSDE